MPWGRSKASRVGSRPRKALNDSSAEREPPTASGNKVVRPNDFTTINPGLTAVVEHIRNGTLDFLLQELFRETNTIGNKANFLAISQIVVGMKTELEKLREQVQNIE